MVPSRDFPSIYKRKKNFFYFKISIIGQRNTKLLRPFLWLLFPCHIIKKKKVIGKIFLSIFYPEQKLMNLTSNFNHKNEQRNVDIIFLWSA